MKGDYSETLNWGKGGGGMREKGKLYIFFYICILFCFNEHCSVYKFSLR